VQTAAATVVRARELAVEGNDRFAAECYAAEAAISMQRGDFSHARDCFLEALQRYQRVGHRPGMVDAATGLGMVAERTGDHAAALEQYRWAVLEAADLDPGPVTLAARRQLALLQLELDQHTVADAELEACAALAETMSDSLEYAATLAALAHARVASDRERAMALAERALDAGHTAETLVEAHLALADAQAVVGNVAAAEEHVRAAESIAERHANVWLGELASRRLAQLHTGVETGIPAI
jgi:tetratricopeptide (TPR) repeat protein